MKLRNLLISGGMATAVLFLTPAISKGELDLPYINSRLDNHEARITNNEKDIEALRNATNTQAAENRITVPVVYETVPTPSASPTPPPEPTEPTPTPAPAPIQYGPVGPNTAITN